MRYETFVPPTFVTLPTCLPASSTCLPAHGCRSTELDCDIAEVRGCQRGSHFFISLPFAPHLTVMSRKLRPSIGLRLAMSRFRVRMAKRRFAANFMPVISLAAVVIARTLARRPACRSARRPCRRFARRTTRPT